MRCATCCARAGVHISPPPAANLPRSCAPHPQVPLLATCQLVQRMVVAAVGAERERAAAEAAALRKEVAHLRAAAPGAAAVAEQ